MFGVTDLNAAQSPAQRAAAFARLPDWSGLWELDGGYRQTLGQDAASADEAKKLEAIIAATHPPFNAE
jgi:hypothetical protein